MTGRDLTRSARGCLALDEKQFSSNRRGSGPTEKSLARVRYLSNEPARRVLGGHEVETCGRSDQSRGCKTAIKCPHEQARNRRWRRTATLSPPANNPPGRPRFE